MNYHSKFLSILVSIGIVMTVVTIEADHRVKVLLEEQSIPCVDRWTLQSNEGFEVYYASNVRSLHRKRISTQTLKVSCKRNSWYINEIRYETDRLMIVPCSGSIQLGDSVYQGNIQLVRHGQAALFINSLDLEDYVYAVLRTESWPGWPLEANKVQAIACRSYVVSLLAEAKKQKRPYDIKNTNYHQTYTGHHSCEVRRKAVDDTRGLFLVHENKPVRAMFDSCCGGVIPAHMRGVNFNDAPYLARTYPCNHCKRCKIYSWRAEYTLSEFEQGVKPHVPRIRELCAVHISKTDKAGVVHEAVLRGKRRNHTIAGKKLYSAFKEVKSFCFAVRVREGAIIIEGKGYGHHLGLCQWGAREMVRDGWDYKRILQFYYPTTALVRLD